MYENNSQEKIIIDLCKRIDVLEEEQKRESTAYSLLALSGGRWKIL